MIRLQKAPIPDILIEKADEWTRDFLDARNGNREMTKTIRFRYRHDEIKEALRREAHRKCIYCEGLTGFGESEHFQPVSLFPDQILLWENLGLVCKECNTHKGDYHSLTEPLINPFIHDPADHLIFLGGLVLSIPNDDMGRRTVLCLELNRMDLIQKRSLRISSRVVTASRWADEKPAPQSDHRRGSRSE